MHLGLDGTLLKKRHAVTTEQFVVPHVLLSHSNLASLSGVGSAANHTDGYYLLQSDVSFSGTLSW